MYSILIYDEIRSMNPPGRFLKQDPKSKLWSDIGKKKALDKTRQALREGAPEMLKELGGDDDEEMGDEDRTPGPAPSKRRRDDNPMNSSFMSNVSIGSFSVDGMGVPSPDLFSSVANQGVGNTPNFMGGGINLQSNHGVDANQALMNAQMQLIQQQMNQWQQLTSVQNALQNPGSNLDMNTQLQLLNLQLQLQNPLVQQNFMNVPSFINPQNPAPSYNIPNANAPQGQLNNDLAALLTAIQNSSSALPNPAASAVPTAAAPPSSALQQLQNQVAMQQLNQQINNTNSANQASSTANGTNPSESGDSKKIENIINAANAINSADQEEKSDSQVEPQTNERKPGGTSRARSQRIGLKNSLTRRPNSHKQATVANSLMSVESLNLDHVDESSEGMQEDD
jgi:hypothetical protein